MCTCLFVCVLGREGERERERLRFEALKIKMRAKDRTAHIIT